MFCGAEKLPPVCVGQNTGSKGFGKDQNISLTQGVVAQDTVWVYQPGNAQAVFGDFVFDGMSAYHNSAGFCYFVITAF